jgi:hypothetical protein
MGCELPICDLAASSRHKPRMMSSSANLNRARNAAHLSEVQSADASNVSVSVQMTWRVTLMRMRPNERR